jgi:mRNA interferase RelE/StbE
MYEVVFTSRAERELIRLDRQVKNRILSVAIALAENPRPPGCIKIKGEENRWRVRVGDWRIGYAIDDQTRTVTIVAVGHRREFYK